MKKRNLILAIYCFWVLFWLGITAYGHFFTGHGEYGISAHLVLLLTGLPLSSLSWFLPHATITGVLSAGVLGWIQWFSFSKLLSRKKVAQIET